MTFLEFIETNPRERKMVILRHDVDKKPLRALRTAEVENGLGIKGSYYFRVNKDEFPKEVIEKIVKLGHEIGYHYNDLHNASSNNEKALDLFQINLARLRELAPVKTACMHGSPMSRIDNRDMWKERNYREFGIIGEPYFDMDFKEVLYLTDTGRRWDGDSVSIRDRVDSRQKTVDSREEEDRRQKTEGRENEAIKRPGLHSTQDIINALRKGELPDQIMLTIHPQRWTDEWGPWVWEFVSQKVKNLVKYFIVRYRRSQVRGDG